MDSSFQPYRRNILTMLKKRFPDLAFGIALQWRGRFSIRDCFQSRQLFHGTSQSDDLKVQQLRLIQDPAYLQVVECKPYQVSCSNIVCYKFRAEA